MVLWIKHRKGKLNIHITTFRHYYTNLCHILVQQYGLAWDDTILVQSITTRNLPHFRNYRTRPKKVFYGTVQEFDRHVKRFFQQNVWKK